jgi:uncharacterized protein (DUF2235 family)
VPEVDPQSLQGKNPEEASTAEPGSRGESAPSRPLFEEKPTSKPNPKNIFVCCDGTGNEFAMKDSLNGNSNVVKLYTALDLDVDQVAYYHPGVGTMGDPTKQGWARKWSVVKGLAFGYGFRDNVLDAYRYLMQHYANGDRVYIFGFSRGAYTARALAGLLHGYGLLCRGNEGHLPYAWNMYSSRTATQKELNARTISTDTSFRDTFSHKGFMIHFVGLWDTVSSVGWISTPLRLLDLAQNPTIERGRHAVSIDERRCFYLDNLWGDATSIKVPPLLKPKQDAGEIPKVQDMLQVWFAGVHSDVGGSYQQLESGLSNITLEWMIDEIELTGARFDPERKRMVLGKPGPGEPTPMTVAMAPLYEKPKSSKVHKSLRGIWWLLEILPHRYYDKDDARVEVRIPLGAYRKIPRGALVHSTVLERLQSHPCYRPKNISVGEIEGPVTEKLKTSSTGYLVFKPKECRRYRVREHWLTVFLTKVLESGGSIYVLWWAFVLGILASAWLWQAAIGCGCWPEFKTLMLRYRPFVAGPWRSLLWTLVMVAAVILLRRLWWLAKPKKTA